MKKWIFILFIFLGSFIYFYLKVKSNEIKTYDKIFLETVSKLPAWLPAYNNQKKFMFPHGMIAPHLRVFTKYTPLGDPEEAPSVLEYFYDNHFNPDHPREYMQKVLEGRLDDQMEIFAGPQPLSDRPNIYYLKFKFLFHKGYFRRDYLGEIYFIVVRKGLIWILQYSPEAIFETRHQEIKEIPIILSEQKS